MIETYSFSYIASPTIGYSTSLEEELSTLIDAGEEGINIPEYTNYNTLTSSGVSILSGTQTGRFGKLSVRVSGPIFAFSFKVPVETSITLTEKQLRLGAGLPNPISLSPIINSIGGIVEESAPVETKVTFNPMHDDFFAISSTENYISATLSQDSTEFIIGVANTSGYKVNFGYVASQSLAGVIVYTNSPGMTSDSSILFSTLVENGSAIVSGISINPSTHDVSPTGNTGTLHCQDNGDNTYTVWFTAPSESDVPYQQLRLGAGLPNPIDITPALENIGGVIEDATSTLTPVVFTDNTNGHITIVIGDDRISEITTTSDGKGLVVDARGDE